MKSFLAYEVHVWDREFGVPLHAYILPPLRNPYGQAGERKFVRFEVNRSHPTLMFGVTNATGDFTIYTTFNDQEAGAAQARIEEASSDALSSGTQAPSVIPIASTMSEMQAPQQVGDEHEHDSEDATSASLDTKVDVHV